MRSFNVLCAASCALVLLAGCGGADQASSSAATSTGGSLAQSLPAQSSSSSSSSQPAAGTATVTWQAPTANTDGSGLTNLAGYNVYYGTDPSNLTESVQVGTTSAELTNLAAGTWYFAVTAYTSTGTESTLSAIVSKTVT